MSADRFSPATGIAVVVANMVGTGVFTSLGFQLLELQSGVALLSLWVVGGVAALCGALCYAELGATFSRSGGEYQFLRQTMHPAAGFVSGWVSATVGFAAPTALAAMTLGEYLRAVWPELPAKLVALLVIATLGVMHSGKRNRSSAAQRWFTVLKVLLIILFCTALWVVGEHNGDTSFIVDRESFEVMGTGTFAVALIYVNYAYTGWNAATYLTGELEHPQRSLSWILVTGTLLVMVLYLLLNLSFLVAAPAAAMKGELEVGAIAAEAAFGEGGGKAMAVMLALLLVSTVSAMLMAGPRVLREIGRDYAVFRWLDQRNGDGVPTRAVMVQTSLALLLVITGTFESVLVFAGFILALNTFLTVVGLLWVRRRRPELPRPFVSPLYPIPAMLYLLITGWTMIFVFLHKPIEALVALALIVAGLLVYLGLGRNRGAI